MNINKVWRILIVSAVGVTLVVAGAGAGVHADGRTVGAATATAPPDTTSSDSLPGAHDGPLPAFSRSTDITNPLFPLSSTPELVYEGEKEGEPYRVTVTLTDQTKTVVVDGITIFAVVAEHRGTLDGELIEVALDYYAQADDGGVWYMGEDVDNYQGGVVADHDGTWLAGVDGTRPGLLVPADPQPGLVYYSEDIPDLGIVERDEVVAIDRTVELPNGEVRHDAVEIIAYKEDGTTETKLYVPGIGMFEERTPDDFVILAEMPA